MGSGFDSRGAHETPVPSHEDRGFFVCRYTLISQIVCVVGYADTYSLRGSQLEQKRNKKKALRTGGGITSGIGCLFGIFPLIVVFFQQLGGNPPANEGEPGGAVGWLLFLTVPLGGLVFLIGLIILLANLGKSTSEK